jgi:hypothetical protein
LATLLGGGVWFLIGQAANFSTLVGALKRADPWWLVPPACAVAALYLSSPRRRGLARDEGRKLRRGVASVVRAIVLLRSAASRRRPLVRGVAGGVLHWGSES